jgi:hypothetical protein
MDITLPPCEEEQWGHLQVSNTQNDSYDFYIDDDFRARFNPGQTLIFEQLPVGEYDLKALEVDGSKVFELNFDVQKCTTNQVVF